MEPNKALHNDAVSRARERGRSNQRIDDVNIRKLHSVVGLACAPFFLITSYTGIVLLWRKDEVYGSDTKGVLIGLHNWEIAAK